MTATSRYTLDPSCRVLDDGRALLGGSPLTLFRLGSSGAGVVEAIRAGKVPPPGHEPLTDRLVDAGAAHPSPQRGTGPRAGEVTVVIPVFGTPLWRLSDLVLSCGPCSVIIVDDASPRPLGSVLGADVHRLDRNVGPGGARAAGLALVATPYVAFLDSDATPEVGWLDALLPHLADDRVALVAPRVRSANGDGRALARYEQWRSPLDLGGTPARVRAGTRVSYVPAAALVARVEALRGIGGFDTTLRYGEDVDLVWRLDEAGWRVRYEPEAVVLHDPRPDARAWLAQRVGYGSSAAPLARRHPGALAPARMNGWSAVAWGVGIVSPPAGVTVAAVTTGLLVRTLSGLAHPLRVAFRLAGLGHLFAGRILASALVRAWFPFALAAALVSKRARRAVALAVVVPPLVAWARDRPRLGLVRALGLHVADDLAYCAGLWAGMVRERSFTAIRPVLTSDRAGPGAVEAVSGRGRASR
ncbi:MAG: mycofactocin biosynthesis glycosyltransferase MftF [Acidimicrobiia bacterium]